jgi:hypothetical protein
MIILSPLFLKILNLCIEDTYYVNESLKYLALLIILLSDKELEVTAFLHTLFGML